MATASELIENKGTAELGGGEVLPQKTDFDMVNKAGENAMLLSAQRGASIFQQRVKDRDSMYSLLDAGQIQSGDLLPKDKEVYDKAEREHEEAFKAIRGINDKEAIAKYVESGRKLKDIVTHGQGRLLQDKSNKALVAKEINPFVKKKMQSEYDEQQNKPFDAIIDPLQSIFQFNKDYNNILLSGSEVGGGKQTSPIGSAIKETGATTPTGAVGLSGATGQRTTVTKQQGKPDKVTTTQTTGAAKPIAGIKPVTGNIEWRDGQAFEISENKLSFDKILDKANSMAFNPEDENFYHLQEHFNMLTDGTMSPKQANEYLDTLIKAADAYKNATGDNNTSLQFGKVAHAGTPEADKAIAVFDNQGKLHLNISKPQLAAMDALAKAPAFVSKTENYREDLTKDKREQDKLAEDKRSDKQNEAIKWYNAITERLKTKPEIEKLNLEIAKMKEKPQENNPFDKAIKLAEKTKGGNAYISSKNLSDLDIKAIVGFDINTDKTAAGSKKTTAQVGSGRLLRNSNGDYFAINTDDAGNPYLAYAVDKNGKTEYKRAYRDDVQNNINVLQATIGGGKGLNPFAKPKTGVDGNATYSVNGKSMSHKDLIGKGYTEEQIKQALELGNIKPKED